MSKDKEKDKEGKKFCIYLWPESSGMPKKVWKFRFSVSLFLFILGIGTVVFIACGIIITDYTRLQLSDAYNSFVLSKSDYERYSLEKNRNQIAKKLKSLENVLLQEKNYQASLDKKFDTLQKIIKKASNMGLISGIKKDPDKSASVLQNKQLLGVGGPEFECSDSAREALRMLGSDCAYDEKKDLSTVSYNAESIQVLEQFDDLLSQLEILPFLLPVYGRISSYYGVRKSPFSGSPRMHHGLDFALPYGSEVFSTAGGRIVSVKRHSIYGLMVDVEHTGGIRTRYAHLSKSLVNVGQTVESGQIIAKVGSSGRSTGPHLHYEVHINGKSINPKKLIQLGRDLGRLVNV